MSDLAAKQERIQQLSNLRSLTEAEREEAYDLARNRIAGKPVEEREYAPLRQPDPEPAEYPDWMIQVVVFLCIVVLVGAFIPSAYRMYVAGYQVFCKAFGEFIDTTPTSIKSAEDYAPPAPEEWLCISVGLTTVVMAEIGQTVALLAIAVLGTTASTAAAVKKATAVSNTIFWTVAGMTTIIAYVGNLHVAQPWRHSGPFFGIDVFAWILDLFPPTLVIGIMYAMKELMLYFIRRRYQYLLQIERARDERNAMIESDRTERKHYLNQPESHPQWLRTYSVAIKEALVDANGRQKGERSTSKDVQHRLELMRTLTNDEWKHLIKLQMVAGDFTVNPELDTAVEKFQARIEEISQTEQRDELLQVPVTFDANDLEAVKASVWQDDSGTWSFKSNLSGYVRNGLASKKVAEKALKQYEYHYNRRNS